ncbi:MAG: cysteine desulfurase [Clostridia bacterium]|nr:cysteine desulfurase [Clostridia bacterium]
MIYLDNAATTSLDLEVLEAMTPYYTSIYGNSQSQHTFGRQAASAVQRVRDSLAASIGCAPEEIYFVSGGTEGDNLAIKGLCSACGRGHIIISGIEHSALYDSALQLKSHGFDLTVIPPTPEGLIRPEDVESSIRPDTVFCGVMYANNETGSIQPVREIHSVCESHGVFFFTDCVQAAPYMPLSATLADGLVFSAHKFYGPKGIAALYIRSGTRMQPLICGGMQERTLRGGTLNVPAIVGLGAAYAKCVSGIDAVNPYIRSMRDTFLQRVLSEIPGTHLNGAEPLLPSHANISFDGCAGENIVFSLDLKGIAVSTGAACSAGAVTPTRVISSMGGLARAKSAVRFSFGKNNSPEEIPVVLDALKECVSRIRRA